MNGGQREREFLVKHAGELGVDFRAGDEEIVHFEFFAGLAGWLDGGIGAGGWAAVFGDLIHACLLYTSPAHGLVLWKVFYLTQRRKA